MTFKYASPEAVSQQWAAAVVGVPTGNQLPTDNTTWAASGFVLTSDAGGDPDMYYPLHNSIFIFQTWACNPSSPYPPWGKARNLVEQIRNETYQHLGRVLVLPNCDQNARVLQSVMLKEPHKVYGDLGNYAAYTVTVELHWVPTAKS